MTPIELATGIKPDISHLRPFYSVCYVHVPKAKRNALKKKGIYHIRGQRGRFIGFQTPRSTTFAVLLDTGHIVHSKNVEFDDEPPHHEAIRTPPAPPPRTQRPNEIEFGHDASLEGVARDHGRVSSHRNPLSSASGGDEGLYTNDVYTGDIQPFFLSLIHI